MEYTSSVKMEKIVFLVLLSETSIGTFLEPFLNTSPWIGGSTRPFLISQDRSISSGVVISPPYCALEFMVDIESVQIERLLFDG